MTPSLNLYRMPIFFGVEYPDIPNVAPLYGSCDLMFEFQNTNSVLSELFEDSVIFLPLKNAVDSAVYEAEATDDDGVIISQAMAGLEGYQQYLINVSSIHYQLVNDALDMYNLAPSTGFGGFVANLFGDAEYPPDGPCDLTKPIIESQIFPRLNAIGTDIGAAFTWAEAVPQTLQQFLDDQLQAAETVLEIANTEEEVLEQIEENVTIHNNIRKEKFATNLSQFSILGAAVFLVPELIKK